VSALLFITLPATRLAYVLLALLVGGEAAGVPLPGETALITGSILASQGKLWLPLVITVAAAAAIVGDNIGYELGRHGARRLLTRPGWLAGANRMAWPRFFAWNALGGISWAISVGVFAYLARDLAVRVLHNAGYVVLALIALAFAGLAVWYFFRRR
jgi:membrane protein DedA with SNARE-associated domain